MIPELAIQIERQLQRLEGSDDADRPRVREEVTAELVRLCEAETNDFNWTRRRANIRRLAEAYD